MNRRRIAIACQGGGSQCAFVAGALKTLLAEGVQNRFQIVGLSGTSGGAFTAALAWLGLLEQAQGAQTAREERIIACWKDLSARTTKEIAFDALSVQLVRLIGRGLLPSIASSPSSLQSLLGQRAAAFVIARPEFTDLRALLVKHLDFESLPSLVRPDSPVLHVGAADVLEGSFKVFSSTNREINVNSLLASAAVPTLFPAVQVDGHYYWDGIFSSNPPVVGFLRKGLMGNAPLPQEIWVIQVNRAKHRSVPETPADIQDRRNHLAGTLSLEHELQLVAMVNLLLRERALTDEFRGRFGLDVVEPVTVRFIRMSQALAAGLDYPSKLSRQPEHIARLIADGEVQAKAFLADFRDADGAWASQSEGLRSNPTNGA
jgi:NTE family protein